MKLAGGVILSGIFIFCIGMFIKVFTEANNGQSIIISLGVATTTLGVMVVIIGLVIGWITIRNKG